MKLNSLKDINCKGKKILLRADFNVSIENGHAAELFKIEACKQSVQHIINQGGKVALISHLGRPEGRDESLSLIQLKADIEKVLENEIIFVDDCKGEKVVKALDELGEGGIILLENVRFYSEEEKNEDSFSQELAKPFDYFVNEAFSVCHRDQSSVTGVTKFLPSYAGFWLEKEIESLNKVMHEPEHPAVAIIGGAKIETKLPLIKQFEKDYDYILVGGKIANEAMDQGLTFSHKVLLPTDFAGDRLDIGVNTIERYCGIVNRAKVVVWNGPMGKFEESPYDQGTLKLLDAVINSDAYSLMGGGESVQVLSKNFEKITFVSTGGGAMLEYLSSNDLPGIEALKTK